MKLSIQRYRATGNLKKTLGKRIVSSKTIIPVIFIGSLIILGCLHVWQRVYVMSLVKTVRSLEKDNKELRDILKKTDMDVIDLSRLARIEPIAVDELGLRKTSTENMFTLTLDYSRQERQGINEVVSSLKKIADNLPVLTETKAAESDLFETNEE